MTTPHPLELQLPALTGTARIDALLELAEYVRPANAQRALTLSVEAQQFAQALEDRPRLTRTTISVGFGWYRLCEYPQAQICCTEALAQARALEDAESEARSLLLLGSIESEQGRYVAAIVLFREALAVCDQHQLEGRHGIALNNLGLAHEHLGDYPMALELYLQGLEIIEEHGLNEHRILIRVNIGNTLQQLGHLEDALTQHTDAQQLADATGNGWGQGLARNNQGSVLLALGRYDEAISTLQAALPLLRAAGYRKGEAEAYDLLGEVHRTLGLFEVAFEYYAQAVKLAVEIGAREEEVQVRMHLGAARLQQGDLIGAQASLEASLKLAKGLGRLREARDVHKQMVQLYERGGAYELALAHCQELYRLDRQLLNETQNQHTQSLLIRHDVETHRQLNVQLQRSNEELALLYQQNQELLTRLQHQMLHDALTGLPNRFRFDTCLRDALGTAEASGLGLAVMFIDLDGFKKVNDTLGHDAGDELLVQVAARFTALIRPDDLVARLSGDEFVAFIGALGGPSEAAMAAQLLLSALDRPFELRGQTVSVSASIGISLYPTDAQNAQALQRCADEAMYRVKRSGKSAVRFYSAP